MDVNSDETHIILICFCILHVFGGAFHCLFGCFLSLSSCLFVEVIGSFDKYNWGLLFPATRVIIVLNLYSVVSHGLFAYFLSLS